MGRKKQTAIPGLRFRGGVWHVEKTVSGKRLFESTGTSDQKEARRLARLPARIHDLKHTFGRRLRAAQVSMEDRQDLLGHKSNRITTHYSPVEIRHLIEAANQVCHRQSSTPTAISIRDRAAIPMTVAERMQMQSARMVTAMETHSGKIPARNF